MAQTKMVRYLAPKPEPNRTRSLVDECPQRDTSDLSSGSMELDDLLERPNGHVSPHDLYPLRSVIETNKALGFPGANIAQVATSHLDDIKRLTLTTLPMRYPDKFFREVTTQEDLGNLARVALFEEVPIGWIRCRLEPEIAADLPSSDSPRHQIYIQALCLLAPYRQRGLASQLLQEVLDSTVRRKSDVTSIYAHVWEKNEEALDWYKKRGFKRVLQVDHYYRRLRPSGAWLVRKELG